jgi:hypothetical protein
MRDLERFKKCCGHRVNWVGRRCCTAEAAPQRGPTFMRPQFS